MKKTGLTVLPLHVGHAPSWLIKRMKALSDKMVLLLVDDYGASEFLRRLSNPYWFQAFGCVLGFDWHSSGVTTVVTGILKDVLKPDRHGVSVAGGKGRAAKGAQKDLESIVRSFNLPYRSEENLKYASRICAKVDTCATQAGYPIYHHTMFVDDAADWALIQQGIDVTDRTARRYHWLSEGLESYVVEPHEAIVGDSKRSRVLDMTAGDAEENRRACVDLVKGDPHNLISSIRKLDPEMLVLDHWLYDGTPVDARSIQGFSMPRDLDWDVFFRLYDRQPEGYEELLAFKGVGPATIRGLALVSELIYEKPACWRDPVKYSFAFGGKDGVPFPVDRRAMDEATNFLGKVVEDADISTNERRQALKRLSGFIQRGNLA